MSLADRVKAAKRPTKLPKVRGLRSSRTFAGSSTTRLWRVLVPRCTTQMSDAELKLRVMEMLEWALEQEQSVPLHGPIGLRSSKRLRTMFLATDRLIRTWPIRL